MKVGNRQFHSLWGDSSAGVVHFIDQARLPFTFETATLASPEAIADAIRTMRVRGAPLIGVAAAFGLAMAASRDPSDGALAEAARMLRATRPTAVNLGWALARMQERLLRAPLGERGGGGGAEAQAIAEEDVALNEAIGRHGLALLQSEFASLDRPINILTHCNAGWGATGGWGTGTV